jgi:hypothetical protein
MKVIKILETPQLLDETTVAVEGVLMYTKDYIYVAQDYESHQNTNTSIQIVEPNFLKKVESSSAPPAGGGISSYPYNVVVERKLRYFNNCPFPAVLDSIKSAYLVNEDGKKYQVI